MNKGTTLFRPIGLSVKSKRSIALNIIKSKTFFVAKFAISLDNVTLLQESCCADLLIGDYLYSSYDFAMEKFALK